MKKVIFTVMLVLVLVLGFTGCDSATDSPVDLPSVNVSAINVTPTAMLLTADEVTSITATVSPSNATNKTVLWTSSDEDVATVAGGVVTPIAAGTTNITVTTVDGSFTATSEVTVANVVNETRVIGYTTIQEAINAANDGDAILVGPGTYEETGQIVIDKNLTLVGASEAGVILNPTANTGASGDNRGWIVVDEGFTLNISNLTMDGSGFDVHQAIRANGAVIADNVTIKNINYPGYMGFGMALMGGDNAVTDITMSNIGRVGMSIYGGDVRHDTVVNGFSYTGKGDIDGLDYAIEVGAYSETAVPFQVDISNVTISDCLGVASGDYISAGILISTYYYAGGDDVDLIEVNIDHANISNCSTGVLVGGTAADTEYCVTLVTNSTFVDCVNDLGYVGIVTTGSFTVDSNTYDGGTVPTAWLGVNNEIWDLDGNSISVN